MRLLVVTGAAVSDLGQLPPSIRALIEGASEVFVITPTLPGPLQWLASDIDTARQVADERLNVVLGQVESLNPSASGQVGDETPLTAFEDAYRSFRPDHILIGLRAGDHAGWQERGLLDQVVADFHLPTTIFEIDAAGHTFGS
jgi:hypothetical protein